MTAITAPHTTSTSRPRVVATISAALNRWMRRRAPFGVSVAAFAVLAVGTVVVGSVVQLAFLMAIAWFLVRNGRGYQRRLGKAQFRT